MSAPRGKAVKVVWASRPWRDNLTDAGTPPPRTKPIKETPQEEIDICLKCKAPFCKYGECIHFVDYRKKQNFIKDAKRIPDGFEQDARENMSLLELSRKYRIAKCTASKWKNTLGLTKPAMSEVDLEQFKIDAFAGMSLTKICKKYHISTPRAKAFYVQIDCPIPQPRNKKREDNQNDTV